MGIEKDDFRRMVERVVKGRERRLHEPEKPPEPKQHPNVSTDTLAYNIKIVTAYFAEFKIPEPQYEYYFHDNRNWRFDLAWPKSLVALEVQGGIWVQGGHVRGAALEREWQKLRAAAGLGWRVLFCSPEHLLTADLARDVKTAIFWQRR